MFKKLKLINEFENKQNDGIVLCGLRNANLPPNKQYSDNSGGVYSVHSINGKLFMEIIDSIDFDIILILGGIDKNNTDFTSLKKYKNKIKIHQFRRKRKINKFFIKSNAQFWTYFWTRFRSNE